MMTAKFQRVCATIILASLLIAPRAVASPEIPGKPQAKPIALVGGTVFTMVGEPIEGCTVLFDKGKIVAVGKDVAIPAGAERIDVKGKHVYPGLFESCSDMGLIEINSVRATIDHTEVGRVNPNVKAQVAFNPDSDLIPVARSNGILLALVSPQGGTIAGQSAVMQMDGWTNEEMTLRASVAMHVNWPQDQTTSVWWVRLFEKRQVDDPVAAMKALKQAVEDARAYQAAKRAGTASKTDLRHEALLPVLEGKTPLVVHADELEQIQSAVAFAEREKLKLILHGGFEAVKCADLLKKHDVPVIVSAVHRLPPRRHDAYDDPYTLPERLRKAGVKFCIGDGRRFNASEARNLPYHAGTAVAFGLPQAEALKAITLYPAQIYGVADRVGSLEAGKDATLLVADGDILEMPTQVEAAFIQGRRVDLANRQTRLWQKYQEKYRRQNAKQ